MNSITLSNISKKFSGQWIFKDVNVKFQQGDIVAITGYNGSGKSTFLQILAGYVTPSGGSLDFIVEDKKLHEDDLYKHIALCAPYLDLIEEMTLVELISFYLTFKSIQDQLPAAEIINITQLEHTADRQIKNFSSGMKQRVKLALALLSDVPFVLLDEPVSNLDQQGLEWYLQLVNQCKKDKILFISSNRVKDETQMCNKLLNIENYKLI